MPTSKEIPLDVLQVSLVNSRINEEEDNNYGKLALFHVKD